jgi:long-chain acyl-CoA synthetase
MGMPIAEATAALTAPGAPFEIEEAVALGRRMKVWKAAPPNLRAMLDASLAHGALPFLVYEGERMSFAEHYRQAAVLGRALAERFGVRKGDRVAIAMRNFPEWCVAFWAAGAIGAIVVPLNAWMSGPELEYCLADSGSIVLIADAERAERLEPHVAGLPLRTAIVTRAEKVAAPWLAWSAIVPATAQATLPDVAIDPDDDATILYTSGTTGHPKGALGSHRNIATNLMSLGFGAARAMLRRGEALPEPGTAPKKAYLLSVPLFHVTGCHSTMIPALVGGHKLVLMYRWDPLKAMQLIEAERINGFGGVPAIAWQVLEHPDFDKYDLSSVEALFYGGAPSPPELVARIRERLPNARPGQGYGLTEGSSVTTQNAAEDYERKPESAGLAIPVAELRVVDAEGRDVPQGGLGELWIRGPHIVKGYWNKPEATAAAFGDGWLKSGDIVRIDEEGFVYILDRAKDMLIRGGENIYCVEVEDALYSHKAVMDAAVIGISHKTLGEEVGAVVQLKPGIEVGEEELKRHVAERLAAFKVPVKIELRREPLPRNAAGKILKRDLRLAVRGRP